MQQFWFHVLSALKADGIVGCNRWLHHPRFLLPCDAGVWWRAGALGQIGSSSDSYHKLYALTRATTLDPAVKAKLAQRGNTS